jgi:glycosyltransferase involved in cell wall biosynthesis
MERARRILYFHHHTELVGPDLLDVLDHIDRSRYDPWVVLPGDGTLRQALESRDLPVTIAVPKRVPRAERYTALVQPGEVSRGRRIIAEVTPDVVHINSTALELIYAGVAARLCSVPVIWRVRQVGDRKTRSEMVAKLVRGCAARVVPVSQAASSWLGSSLNGQVVVIPDSVDTDLFSPHIRPSPELCSRLGISADVPAVGHIGLMVPVRRVKDFIRAAAVVCRSVDARFVIVNSDPDRHQTLIRDLRRLAKELGMSRRLQFASPHIDLADLLPCLDIVVSSSGAGSLTLDLMKAAACGKPIIAARSSTPAGIIHEKTGLVVEPNNVDALAGSMLALIDNPEQVTRLGAAGRSHIVEHFSTHFAVRRIETLYDEVIGAAAAREFVRKDDRVARAVQTFSRSVQPPVSIAASPSPEYSAG